MQNKIIDHENTLYKPNASLVDLKISDIGRYDEAIALLEADAERGSAVAMTTLIDRYAMQDVDISADYVLKQLHVFAEKENLTALINLGAILIGNDQHNRFFQKYGKSFVGANPEKGVLCIESAMKCADEGKGTINYAGFIIAQDAFYARYKQLSVAINDAIHVDLLNVNLFKVNLITPEVFEDLLHRYVYIASRGMEFSIKALESAILLRSAGDFSLDPIIERQKERVQLSSDRVQKSDAFIQSAKKLHYTATKNR